MSTVHLATTLRANAADQQSTVQKLLDENSRLIDIIREYQNQSRADEALKHQQLLHRNLMHLANLADPFLLSQLKDDGVSHTELNGQSASQPQPGALTPPHHNRQPTQHSQQSNPSQAPQSLHHHQGQMMPPQAVPSPSMPSGSMQPPHGFAPPPMAGPHDMMNHQAYQAQIRAQQQQQQQNGPPPQGYPPFGQPAPQIGGQRMPYPYPPQGMPGYPPGPPTHGYEGYPPPGAPPPQGYMR